ncbi:unnamed protein product [Danaus chrysippus]|uniref:Mediator of RNA polymerase II transcription subunit 9 n=1 Tax=Danaus chrysippus TaxID=151541 RepID=A0A8J2WFS5_9NEOP|nr:unnamed protein product [Danaus chrysippus]
MDNTDHSEQNNFSPLTVQEVDVDFLPIVYEIIRSVERDFHDNSAKVRESQDCSLKVLELQRKFDVARSQIKRLPGIEYNKQDQLKQFEILSTQLRLKRELLQRYLRRAAQLAVSVFFKGKEKISDIDPGKLNRFLVFLRKFRENLREGINDAKRQLKK